MKKIDINTSIEVYDQTAELKTSDQQLMAAAKDALSLSYSPYSNFKVGAAVLLENGEIVKGANYENAAYPMCICAERAAIAAAESTQHGKKILAMAITVSKEGKVIDQPAAPCGACRQVLLETEIKSQSSIQIMLQGEQGVVYKLDSAKALLPLYFDGSFLEK